MKARSKELLDRAIAATVAAIEIYNKPDFLYREEAFAVLAINGWELLLKAKCLADHGNKLSSLYVREQRTKKDGSKSKKLKTKETRSGNPFTHSLDFLAKKLVESQALDANAWANIQALLEMRDSSIHFYNRSGAFPVRLQEIGTASLKNFVTAAKEWFGRDMTEFNFYLMPLSFVALPQQTQAVVLNHEEKRFLAFVESLEPANDSASSPYSVTVNIDIKFTRSKAKGRARGPAQQQSECGRSSTYRRTDSRPVSVGLQSLDRRMPEALQRFQGSAGVSRHPQATPQRQAIRSRSLSSDPGNTKSSKKPLFNPNILKEFDKQFTQK